jgi:peptide chain release factor 1
MQPNGGCFECTIVEQRPGIVQFTVSGQGARALFANEGGGHRWQRIPPTEKRGRVQTSTVTVAVMDPDSAVGEPLDPRDVEIIATRGSGPGGQKRNVTSSCIIATHRPSGIQVRIDNERSQSQNRAVALKILAARLYDIERERLDAERTGDRRRQVGSGMRGDKVRTYRAQDDKVVDHRTGQKWNLQTWMKGNW